MQAWCTGHKVSILKILNDAREESERKAVLRWWRAGLDIFYSLFPKTNVL